MVIREAAAAELQAACALWLRAEAARTGSQPDPAAAGALVAEMATAVAKPGAHLLVGFLAKRLVAVIYGVPLRANPTKAQVAMLAVEPTEWGQGIGSQLLAALTDAMKTQGCVHLRMNVDPANHRARALYERHGWRHLGETEAVADQRDPELIYRVDLPARP